MIIYKIMFVFTVKSIDESQIYQIFLMQLMEDNLDQELKP